MLRGKEEGEMALLSEELSVKESPEDKQSSASCVRGSAKISWQVTLALYTGSGGGTPLLIGGRLPLSCPGGTPVLGYFLPPYPSHG